ncbi:MULTISPECIES: Fe-S-containing hydro-lyase [Clostridium]|uniref:Fumarate hydratase n=1 Tax=Clostridium haemolyticum NCTC 9693 TaxID=1443114 RepID=A0ABR4TGF8_CLOHA|nr:MULTISPECIES: Fe-S-containing hydro-lyase [Clostridium]KEI15326.1 fumarate hydratase [Clostridium novyi B str. NCTC 9691]KEI18031.1 fumarate hydratase [Clostridium haemolyticum NCTC 9693]KGM99798.1 fumarate hydratase [Clostridium haemolyticum NCTC 8350]OOB76098.1 fumarate hydratase [Clostridium haemolyticum]CAG7840564.1 Fumarate hydratase class I, anaerobic [Clostridium haemolyticum]
MKVELPLTEETIKNLSIGDKVELYGIIYTARDVAHSRLVELIKKDEKLPIELKGQVIFYVGPSPAKPGEAIGSAGPTTSYRMDGFTPILLNNGLKGMIGKGPRSKEVKESIIKNKAIYFSAVGGAGALISKSIKKSTLIAYPDLGPEAIRRLEVEGFPAIVVNDMYGNDLYEEGRKKYELK